MLRNGTLALHRRVDEIYSRSDLSCRRDYVDFLTAQAAALFPTEQELERAGADSLLPGWQDSRRSGRLCADLEALGAEVPAPLIAPTFSTAAEIWGGIYVLEGSRLGGALLRRSVAPDFPVGFLGAAHPRGAWRSFLLKLNAYLVRRTEIALATAAAQRVFLLFEQAGLRFIGGGRDRRGW